MPGYQATSNCRSAAKLRRVAILLIPGEVGHRFRTDPGHPFRFEVGHPFIGSGMAGGSTAGRSSPLSARRWNGKRGERPAVLTNTEVIGALAELDREFLLSLRSCRRRRMIGKL